jgi:hypothetical protein
MARLGIALDYVRDIESNSTRKDPTGGLPRLATIEVTPDEVGPNGVKLRTTSEEEERIARGETVTFLVGEAESRPAE